LLTSALGCKIRGIVLCNLALYHAMLHEKESVFSLLSGLAFDPDNPDFLFQAGDTQPEGCRADLIGARNFARLFRDFCKRLSYLQQSEIRSTFSQAGRP
jgi:hypothetical protein